jgi:hypothetical protein
LSLSGDITDFDLADVIQLIGRNRKTGKLIVSGGRNFVTIYFKNGQAVFSGPAHQRDHLGNILVRRGIVSREDVEAALAVQRTLRKKGQNIRIGSILAARGKISRKTLEHLIRIQIEETVTAALSETDGRFEFIPEMELENGDLLVAVDPEWIILETSRQLDEWEVVGRKAPARDAIFAINPDPETTSTTNLDLDAWRVVSLVNGVRTVEEVVNRAGMSRLDALQTLSRLIELRVVVESRAGTERNNGWNLVAETYQPPQPPEKGILGRIIDRIRRL